MVEYLEVGKIVNTQGIKGEVRVISQTDFPEERYKKGAKLSAFVKGKEPIELTVASHRKHKSFDLLTFEGYPSINDVEILRDSMLMVQKNDLSDLNEHEYYYYEIIGLEVYEENGEKLGQVKEILSPGANDVWVVQRKNKPDALIPFISSVVKKIDLTEQKVYVEIPEGLLDDED
ncbi:ribosome maturation factor RimM [Tetragenococcus koreensis]|uniref:Ribosome maturation factor RimM n=1 Tax=Tetragenococcus koreensis TaxID=290335 RepID=A0AAN4UCL1_9ENTE|nr:ribosome maturation factor RimM [Tetragenococcus koreensis]AYW44571.1 ribosome maturation factor RimM [Tetragenococcus koreensis]MCF1584539.1 ribosome maturation factor RimM [Tetragenococcus koreensis]MCF1614088.1 ribosome maturation factor RimM [Tetragenococcus koreensis]MCF1623866.1 ribosome maturation factor RimM [Tetragenococcus koreensis]MCF1628862.1 ribosome maturation factor RimM [Tetragenococcus koreensis]